MEDNIKSDRTPMLHPWPLYLNGWWLFFSCIASLLFAFPCIVILLKQGDYLSFANESLAYRYFSSERILNGEGANVWLPQGFLTSLIQHGILWSINQLHLAQDSFQGRINLFALLTNLVNITMMTVVFIAAGQSRRLIWTDKLLLALCALVPIYGTSIAGFYYSIAPDYYHLNIVLVVIAVWAYLLLLRDQSLNTRGVDLVILGVLSGLMIANKVSLVVVAAMAVGALLFKQPLKYAHIARQAILISLCTGLTFLFVICGFYLFKVRNAAHLLPRLIDFIGRPWEEPNFWDTKFLSYLQHFNYGFIGASWMLVFVFTFGYLFRHKHDSDHAKILLLLNVAAAIACGIFLFKRPAGSTFFEVAVILVSLTAMMLALIPASAFARVFIVLIVVCQGTVSAMTFPAKHNISVVEESSQRAETMWQIHYDTLHLAAGRPIIVIIPDNSYHHEGVHEFLLKGAADFPTWNISAAGEKIIHRFAPGMTFRHEYGGIPPSSAIPENVVVIWFDLLNSPALTEKYASLNEANLRPGVVCSERAVEKTDVTVHMCSLP